MARPKVLFVRHMPYTTTLNRARQFRLLGWEPYMVYTATPANSDMFIQMGRVFEGVWSAEQLDKNFESPSEFVRAKGFDMVYTVGPPDHYNCRFAGVPAPWIHDFRDLIYLVDPHADDPGDLAEAREVTRENTNHSFTCEHHADLVVFVTPWQQTKAKLFLRSHKIDPGPSIWLPNIPFVLPKINKSYDADMVRFGYAGSVAAAWQNASTVFGEIAKEVQALGKDVEFHFWSFMQATGGRRADWYVQHESLEQHAMIAELADHIDYGLVPPPTKSDGLNGSTGWSGKIGDYVAAEVDVFVPSSFLIRDTLRKNGWGFAYDTPKDIARIMVSGRRPSQPRKPAPYLREQRFMDVLESGIDRARQAFAGREVKPVKIQVKASIPRLLVASDGNRYHAERHVAPILGVPWSSIIKPESDIEGYKRLYLLGLWPRNNEELELHTNFIDRFERVVLHWAGSDVERTKGLFDAQQLAFLKDPKFRHFAQHRTLADQVQVNYGVGCTVVNTPTRYVYESPFRLPKRFAVSVYYSQLTNQRALYGCDVIDRVMQAMPEVLFYCHWFRQGDHLPPKLPNVKVLDPISELQYPEFLKHVSAFLRLTSSDGVPYSMVEHACAGRRCVMQQPFPKTITVERNVDVVVEAIQKIQKEREPDYESANYWRAYNDFDRFRSRIKELFEQDAHGPAIAESRPEEATAAA